MHVGLTGGIGSGKSTVAAMFSKRGAYVIDYDKLAHYVVEPDKPAWKDIVEFFGESVLKEDRTLDRPRLGEIVFADKDKRKKLESFIYPRLAEEYSNSISKILEKDHDAIIIADVPLLFETGMQNMFEKIILVYATREQQLSRAVERGGLDKENALRRLEAQMPLDEKITRSDYVIHNTNSLAATETEVQKVWEDLHRLSREKAGKSS